MTYSEKTLRDYLNEDLPEAKQNEIHTELQDNETLAKRVTKLYEEQLPPEASPYAERPGVKKGERRFFYWLKRYRYAAISLLLLAILAVAAYWWLA